MFKSFTIAAATVVALAAPSFAADTYEKYGEENGWTIWANTTTKGCFLENRNNNGNVVQMGLTPNKQGLGFVGIWNHNTPIMEPGETRDMSLDVDGNGYTFVAAANEGTVSEGLTGGYMYVNNPDFVSDVENGQVMTIHTTAENSVEVDLTGTKKGIEMARACYASMNG